MEPNEGIEGKAGLNIRPATTTDRSAVEALYLELKTHHHELVPDARRYGIDDDTWAQAIRESMSDPETLFFVAERGNRVIGFMRLRMEEKTWGRGCEVDTVVVTERARGKGVGERLMAHAEEVARANEATGMRVNVLSANDRGRSFYEKLGYELLAHRFGKDLG